MQIGSSKDNLHEMSNHVFWENNKHIINLSAELAQRVLKVNRIGKTCLTAAIHVLDIPYKSGSKSANILTATSVFGRCGSNVGGFGIRLRPITA